MAFELIHKPTFASQLLLIDSNQVKHILHKIEDLRTDPTPAGNHKKPLKGNRYRGVFRLRYGKYRVLYTYSEQERWVTLLGVDTRDDVYRGGELVEAEGPDIDVKRLPSISDLLGPATTVPAPSVASAAPPSAGDSLPIALTGEVLGRLYIAPQYWAALTACQTFDELAAAPIPSIVQNRVFDAITSVDIDRALEQPGYVTGSVDNLLQFTEGKLSAFLLQLSPEQERFVTRALHANGPTLLKGGPGSGKSTIALYRVQALLKDLKATNRNPRILFTTYTNALIQASEQLLATLLGEDARFVDVRTVDSLSIKIADPNNLGLQLASNSQLSEAMAVAISKVQFHGDELQQRAQRNALTRISHDYILEEMLGLIEARRLTTVQSYLQASRPGRRVPLNATQRTALWTLRERFRTELEARGLISWEQLRVVAANRVAAGEGPARYDAVMVDEAQDLNPSSLWMLTELCTSPDHLFITADANQSIYGAGFRWSDVHADLRFSGRTGILHTNFRSTKEIGEGAQVYLREGALDDEQIEHEYYHSSGLKPGMRAVRDAAEETDLLRRYLPAAARAFQLGIDSCAVLCPSENAGNAIAAALTAAGVNAHFMRGRDLDLNASGVKVITLQSSKGLEFPIVAVAGFVQGYYSGDRNTDQDERAEASARERRTMFVAMTRAMRALLVLTPAGSTSSLFQGFDPAYWNLA